MQPEDQRGENNHDYQELRYRVIPRTLVFLTHAGPHADWILLLHGAVDKRKPRLWARKYNGLGGHIEPGESPYQAAKREVYEESGLLVPEIALRAIIHVTLAPRTSAGLNNQSGLGKSGMPTTYGTSSPGVPSGVMLFVFVGEAPEAPLHPSEEGDLVWVTRDAVATLPLVEDLPELLPRVLDTQDIVFGHYWFNDEGLQIEFEEGSDSFQQFATLR